MALNELISERPVINGLVYNPETDLSSALHGIDEINSHYYLKPREFERGRFYEYLGVKGFKKLLMNTLGRFVKSNYSNSYYIGSERNIDSLLSFEKYARFNEKVHLLGSFFSFAGLFGDNYFPLISGLFLALNVYCCLVQRYNRARVINTLEEHISQ